MSEKSKEILGKNEYEKNKNSLSLLIARGQYMHHFKGFTL